jgi:hypothetical protein
LQKPNKTYEKLKNKNKNKNLSLTKWIRIREVICRERKRVPLHAFFFFFFFYQKEHVGNNHFPKNKENDLQKPNKTCEKKK